MGRPLKYIVNTDYATLKNDSDTTTVTISVPAGDSIPAGGYKSYTSSVTVGTAGAPMEFQIYYSSGTQRWLTPALLVVENAGSPTTQYQGYVSIYRSTATIATIRVDYFNPNGSPVSTTARTITGYVRTYLPPF